MSYHKQDAMCVVAELLTGQLGRQLSQPYRVSTLVFGSDPAIRTNNI